MTENHPITPFIDLVKQWSDDWHKAEDNDFDLVLYVALQATRWGADQELNECCKWLPKLPPWSADDLRKHRRPKPPSLKEQALAELELLRGDANAHGLGFDAPAIRRALEALPE